MADPTPTSLLLQAQGLISSALTILSPQKPIILVKKGDNLQKAIDAAPQGAEIRVYPDTYDGIILRGRAANLTIRPDTADFAVPSNSRVTLDHSPTLIKLNPTSGPLPTNITSEQGASGYNLIGFQMIPGRPDVAMADLGSTSETNPLNQPSSLTFDSCIFLADPLKGGKRGIGANTGLLNVVNSLFDNFWWGDDSQALSSWNGPGPFFIQNNWMAASGENVIFGGADAASPAMMANGVIIRGNTLTKRIEWKGLAGHTVKNVVELKAATNVLIENNILENSWVSGQIGFLVVLTPRNQDGNSPWSTVSNVVIQNNVLRHGAGGFQLLGTDNDHPSGRLSNIQILNNLLYDINTSSFGGNGRLLQISGSPLNVEVGHNTFQGLGLNSFLSLDIPAVDGLNLHHNILPEGDYGITGNGTGVGMPSWTACTVNSTFANNLIQKGTSGRNLAYPSNTLSDAGESVVDAGFNLLPKFGAGIGANLPSLLALTKASL